MPGVIKNAQYLLGLIFMMLFLSACAKDSVDSWPKQTGQVLDEITNKPIANSIVVARWKGTAEYSKTVCFHVESTTTDKNGKFTIPTWKNITKWKYTENQNKVITVYKEGYKKSKKTYKERTDKQGEYYQKPFSGTREERLWFLKHTNRATGCGSAGASQKNLLPLAKAIYKEAQSITKTEADMKIADNLLFSLEIIELGYEAAERSRKVFNY